MDLILSIESTRDPAVELRNLRDWLHTDDDFRGSADLAIAAPGIGEMGTASETVNVVIGSGGVAALASALSVWLRTRTSDVKVRIRSGDREIAVDATNVDDAEPLLALLRGEAT
jgi:hypothetical protein